MSPQWHKELATPDLSLVCHYLCIHPRCPTKADADDHQHINFYYPAAMSAGWFTTFTNCRYVLSGELISDHLVISDELGTILRREGYIGGECVDLEDSIIAPGFLELQTNGVNGFHFTQFENEAEYKKKLESTAKYYIQEGVTGWWATIPTVAGDVFKKVRYLDRFLAFMVCSSYSYPSLHLFNM
jgi:hypothetical protein